MKIKAKKYNAHYDVRKYKGPCFVILSHLSRIDHAYVLEACFNMVAGYPEFFRSHLHFAFHRNNVPRT